MVMACGRPMVYKERVLSRQGHLSNDQCIDALIKCSHSGLKHVVLAHLSQECNNPTLALKKAKQVLLDTTSLEIALQDEVSREIIFD